MDIIALCFYNICIVSADHASTAIMGEIFDGGSDTVEVVARNPPRRLAQCEYD
jgi:hypothetical protein